MLRPSSAPVLPRGAEGAPSTPSALPGADGFDQGTTLSWAQESMDLVTHPRVQYCRKTDSGCQPWARQRYALSADYQAINWPVAKRRLAQAGYRLAGLMNRLMAAP